MPTRQTLRHGKTRTTMTFYRAETAAEFDGDALVALLETLEEAAAVASGYCRVDTGEMRDSMDYEVPRKVNGKWRGNFGSYGVDYTRFWERKEHMIQRAADEVLPTYPQRLLARRR